MQKIHLNVWNTHCNCIKFILLLGIALISIEFNKVKKKWLLLCMLVDSLLHEQRFAVDEEKQTSGNSQSSNLLVYLLWLTPIDIPNF